MEILNFHPCDTLYLFQGGKLVATVAPTTLPHLNQSEHKHHHHKHHQDDTNTLPSLKQSDSFTRQNTYSTIGTPDRGKRDQYGNRLPLTPAGA